VTDNRGGTASTTKLIMVRRPPQLMRARVTMPGTFTFNLEGETNVTYILLSSADGMNWTNVMTLPSPDLPAPATVPTSGQEPMQLWRAVMQ